MRKALVAVALAAGLALAAAVVWRDAIAKAFIEGQAGKAAGVSLRVDSVHIGVFRPSLQVNGLRVANPAGFHAPFMADVTEVYAACDPVSLLQKCLHCSEVRVHARELSVEIDPGKGMNVKTLAPLIPGSAHAGSAPAVKIDRLRLAIGRVRFVNAGVPGMVKSADLALKFDETFRDVSDPRVLGRQVLDRLFDTMGITELLRSFGGAARHTTK